MISIPQELLDKGFALSIGKDPVKGNNLWEDQSPVSGDSFEIDKLNVRFISQSFLIKDELETFAQLTLMLALISHRRDKPEQIMHKANESIYF